MNKVVVERPVDRVIPYIRRMGWITRARTKSLHEFMRLRELLKEMPQEPDAKQLHLILNACQRVRQVIYTKSSRMNKGDRIYLQRILKEIEVPCGDELQMSLRIEGIQNGVR